MKLISNIHHFAILRATLALFMFSFGIHILNSQEFEAQNDFISDIIENLEIEGDIDFNTVFERLIRWSDKPFNINKGDISELVEVFLITDLQSAAIKRHLIRHGPLLSLYELQSIDELDMETIRNIRHFVGVSSSIEDFNASIPTMVTSGTDEIFTRWARTLETQKGYTPAPDTSTSRYLGDPNRIYFRYRHSYENRLSYGITAEKDAGEVMFKPPNESGFDFYSAHFFLKNYRSWLKSFALGDFQINMGQGLIQNGSFASAKSSYVTQIRRGGSELRPFRSVNEADFLRGIGATFGITPNIDLTVFGSIRKRDGNVILDTIDSQEDRLVLQTSFSSLLTSGLHRTPSEIENKNKTQNETVGAILKYKRRGLTLGANVLYNRLSDQLQRPDLLYNAFRFSGDRLFNASLDYGYLWRNFHFFGETAWSDNGAVASINGLLISLDRDLDAAILVRSLPKDYHSLIPNVFAESADGSNENGIYLGLDWRPSIKWTISGYFDTWRHPWLRFSVDGPSQGNEQLLKVRYYLKRKLELYVQFRNENKQRNRPNNETPVDFLVWRQRQQLRIHLRNQVSKSLTLRNRLEFSKYRLEDIESENGFMIYQDILYHPIASSFSFTARVALFDTDGFNSRIYAYENDLIYNFFIPAYSDRGVRYYINLRYKGIRNLTAELRLARTEFTNRNTISSGLNEIEGNHRTDVKVQFIYRWK